MRHFTFLLILLCATFIEAKSIQIDMHGGKDTTMPSQHKQISNMKEMLNIDTNTTDNNTSVQKK